MKKVSFILLFIICLTMSSCINYKLDEKIDYTRRRDRTVLYTVEKYKVHEAGVEIWATSENNEEYGFFVKHEDIFPYEDFNETTSRVIAIQYYCSDECIEDHFRHVYLYFSKDEFLKYIEEKIW